jgi:hypothetical protein
MSDRRESVPAFTPQQLADWKAYERVRKSGRYNMFDPRARRANRLGPEAYSFTMKFFTELQAASISKRKKKE